MSMFPGVPDVQDYSSVAQCLEQMADTMETARKAMGSMFAQLIGEEPPPEFNANLLVGDLRMWATWLRANPEVDAQLMALSGQNQDQS